MRIFNGLKIGDIVVYEKDQKKYRIMELIQNEEKRMCKIMSISNSEVIYEVPVELCKKV